MARHHPNHRGEDEEESAFVSMTDLMISILFIVMILMAFFARSLSQTDQETVAKSEYERVVTIMQKQIETNENLIKTIEKREQKIKDLEKEIDDIQTKINQKDDQIASQAALLDKKDQQIQNYVMKINSLALKIKDLEQGIVQKDNQIKNLQEMIIDLKSQISQQEKEINKKNIELTEKEQKIDSQQLKIDEKDIKIRRLKRAVERLERKLEELQKTKDTELAKILDEISKTRSKILKSIKLKLEDKGIKVQVDTVSGIIRFDESVINFASGSFKPSAKVTKIIQQVAEILETELGCYSLGSSSTISLNCNKTLSILEAVQIEGHTDNIRLGSVTGVSLEDNLDLSAKRAAAAFRIMIAHRQNLMQFENANFISLLQSDEIMRQGQPILSVSGYGEMRPVVSNDNIGRSANRRIDLRIIMTTPKSVPEANQLSTLINGFLRAQDKLP